MQREHSLFIDNKWQRGAGCIFRSHDPATGVLLWEGASASLPDVSLSLEAAKKAFPLWSEKPTEERAGYLLSFAEELRKSKRVLAETIAKEIGKPLWESAAEVDAMIQKVDVSIRSEAQRCGTLIQEHLLGQMITRHRPHGVLAVFGPFNFPGHLPLGHIIPALLAGNTIIFKPSEYAPLVSEEIISCWERTGLPKGVINLLQGAQETGKLLSRHPGIDGLLFTGSYSTGKQLAEFFSGNPGKILALEMGGNNPLIVARVEDISAAIYTIIQSSYITSGQRCTCARRLIVVDEMAEILLPQLTERVKKIIVGPYHQEPEPFMGPVISFNTAEHLLKEQETLLQKGAKPLLPMKLLKANSGLLSPGLLDVSTIANLPDEEIFGPLLQVTIVGSFQEGIKKAQETTYGLAAGLLSDSHDDYRIFSRSVRAGIMNWNVPLTGASSWGPFGGIGRSGNHRPSAYYAADYCSYPVAAIENRKVSFPKKLSPGIF